jgi:hypothetical protein
MKKLKTSSKIAFNFMVYEILILVLFSITVNLNYLFTWTSHSKDEIRETISKEYHKIYFEQNSKNKFEDFKSSIMDM